MKYNRILVKLSGEALADKDGKMILSAEYLDVIAKSLKKIVDEKVQLAVVVGAGNIWRGKLADQIGIERSTADYMGMMGTIINALAIESALENNGVPCRVLSALDCKQVAEPFIRKRAIRHLEKGRVVVFAGGTGNPFFTTDTTAALRARDIDAEAIFAAKNGVEGVYDSDPRKNKNAKFLSKLTYNQVMAMGLQVMDQTAIAMLNESPIETRVFNMADPDNFVRVLHGEDVGTTITKGE